MAKKPDTFKRRHQQNRKRHKRSITLALLGSAQVNQQGRGSPSMSMQRDPSAANLPPHPRYRGYRGDA
jgi:hypothetical protein